MDSWDICYWQNDSEAKVMLAFLEWQGKNPNFGENGELVLRETRGHGGPIAYHNHKLVAKGLLELIKYFEDNGLMRLA
jgi:hypothetical protein